MVYKVSGIEWKLLKHMFKHHRFSLGNPSINAVERPRSVVS